MTVLRGLYVFGAYVLLMPWMLMFTLVHFVHACIESKQVFGKCKPIWVLKAYGEGCKEGYKIVKGYVKTGELKYVS